MLRFSINLCVLLIACILAWTGHSHGQEVVRTPADEIIADDSWVMVLIPDTQGYVDDSERFPTLMTMTDWIAKNQKTLNIQMVIQVGDIVYQNGIPVGAIGSGDQSSEEQWDNAQAAFHRLNGIVPYILVTGNHDYGISDAQDRGSLFDNYFTPQDNPLVDPDQGGILAGMGTNAFGVRTLENAAYDFTAPDGRKFLFLGLEWGPRQAAVNWARRFAGQPEYDDHLKVLITHAYMFHDDTRLDWSSFGVKQSANPHIYQGTMHDTNDGEELWNELVRQLPNSQLVFSGHIGGDMVGFLDTPNDHGQIVHQMLFNAQFLPNGGNGWLRLLEFTADGKTVVVHTYSPLFALEEYADKSPWRLEPHDNFSFELTPIE